MKVYDLFCGAGGASAGLAALGLDVVGFDAWAEACASHEANGHATVCADLNTIDWAATVAEHGRPELLWASPPCQPFSAAGKQAGAADPRDGMPAFVRAVAELEPRIVAMENVKGLTWAKHRWYLDAAVADLERLGYDVAWRVLNAADFGVPQTRERLILIARRDGSKLVWPIPTHAKNPGLLGELPWVSMAEALGWTGMVGFPRSDDGRGPEHVTEDGYRKRDWRDTARPSAIVTEKARSWQLRAGNDENATVRPVDQPAPTLLARKDPNGLAWVLNTGRDWKKGGTRDDAQRMTVGGVDSQWQWRRPATTISGDSRVWPPGHKVNQADRDRGHGDRYAGRAGVDAVRVSVEEAAVLQGFPEGYVFCGSRTAQFQQVGNACPPGLARAVVEALLD